MLFIQLKALLCKVHAVRWNVANGKASLEFADTWFSCVEQMSAGCACRCKTGHFYTFVFICSCIFNIFVNQLVLNYSYVYTKNTLNGQQVHQYYYSSIIAYCYCL